MTLQNIWQIKWTFTNKTKHTLARAPLELGSFNLLFVMKGKHEKESILSKELIIYLQC